MFPVYDMLIVAFIRYKPHDIKYYFTLSYPRHKHYINMYHSSSAQFKSKNMNIQTCNQYVTMQKSTVIKNRV